MKQTNVIVNLQYEALHHWPDCNIDEVAYLKDKHRHTFHIECKKTVKHNDRDVEIIQFKSKIWHDLKNTFNGDFGTLSCEQIAGYLVTRFNLSYCKVLEDGENGAEVYG